MGIIYMTDWGDGEMDELTVVCPVCDGDGEFITEDDVYTCCGCGGIGYISAYRYKKLCDEMEWLCRKEIREET